MADVFGSGDYALVVEWKEKDSKGKSQISVYRYKNEKTRDKKLQLFQNNSNVKRAGKHP